MGLDMQNKCATVGCANRAEGLLSYSVGSPPEDLTDRVCLRCGCGYVHRPTLWATYEPDFVRKHPK